MLKQKLLKNKAPVNGEPESDLNIDTASPYFNQRQPNSQQHPLHLINPTPTLWQQFYSIECRLNQDLRGLSFILPPQDGPPVVAAVYNPVEYAHRLHCQFLERFLCERPTILFVGMNPGPWGMCQTGVPFGCVSIVRNWMRLSGSVDKPSGELPERRVVGLDCERVELSGKKFWALFRDIFGPEPGSFFKRNFVHNFCPLAFFKASGRNITPAELKGDVRLELQRLCNNAFLEILELLQPVTVISVGRYAETRVQAALKSKRRINVAHHCMPHPSSRSHNNADWPEKAKNWLQIHKIFDNLP